MAQQYQGCYEQCVPGLPVPLNREQRQCSGEHTAVLNFSFESNVFPVNSWQKRPLEEKSNGALSKFIPEYDNHFHDSCISFCDSVKGFRDATRLDLCYRQKCSFSPSSVDKCPSPQDDVLLIDDGSFLDSEGKPASSLVTSVQLPKSLSRVDNLPLRKVMSLRFAAAVTKSECEMSPPSLLPLNCSEKYSPDSANGMSDGAVHNSSSFCGPVYSDSDVSTRNSCKVLQFSAQPPAETVDLSLGCERKHQSHSAADAPLLSSFPNSNDYFDSCLQKEDTSSASLISDGGELLCELPAKRLKCKAEEQAVSTSYTPRGDAVGRANRKVKRLEKPTQRGRKGSQSSSKAGTGDKEGDEKPHTTTRLDLPSQMDNGFCQVCGDIAAGFYCGAFICEACKKFFIRASKQEKHKFVCLRQGSCKITKESRVQCQFCRYQKCLDLQMYYPGEGKRTVNAVGISDIPCRVCGAPSSGFHFGALTCEGCKGFFRRMVKEREPGSYRCSAGGTCEISAQTRNMCKACRYQKCVDIGMSVDGSRIGRQPNAVKHAISLEVKRKSLETASTASSTGNCGLPCQPGTSISASHTSPLIKQEPHSPECPISFKEVELFEVTSPSVQLPEGECQEKKKLFDYEEMITGIEAGGVELARMCVMERAKSQVFDQALFSTLEGTWKKMMTHFEFHAQCIIRFAKKVPGFRQLPLDDQVLLVQLAIYPIVILSHSRGYDLKTGFYNYFNFSKTEEEAVFKMCPTLNILRDHFKHMGIMTQSMNLDNAEYTLLSCMLLVDSECPGLAEKEQVLELQNKLLHVFQLYEERSGKRRFGELMLRISELSLANMQHGQVVSAFVKEHPDLEVPGLYKEMFF